jgi:coenzyme Q-binding protein COQ10
MTVKPFYEERALLPLSCKDVFDLVANVAAYPEFLPWCLAARVTPVTDTQHEAELLVGKGPLKEAYTSLVTLTPHTQIHAAQIKGPLKRLDTLWTFTPKGAGCQAHLALDLELGSGLSQMLLGAFFKEAAGHMLEAFKARALSLYQNTK